MYGLEDEYENELLASIHIEYPVRNSTNYTVIESETSEQVTDENTEPSSNNINNNQRFLNMSSAEIDEIITRAETENTKDNTKWAVRVSEGKFYAVKCKNSNTANTRTLHFCVKKKIRKLEN